MGLRFRKSIKLGKHFSVNLSPKGIGYSYGVKGARHSVSADGRHRTTYSVPGTGLTYTTSSSSRSSGSTPSPRRSEPTPPKNTRKSPGCLILVLLFIAVSTIALACSDADTDTTEQPTLPSMETSERSFPAPDTETEPTETEPTVQLPVIVPVETEPAETPAPETIPPETVPPETVPPETEPPKAVTYYLNTSSQKIHRADCSSVPKIKDSNKSTTTDPESKLAEGYTWCGICH